MLKAVVAKPRAPARESTVGAQAGEEASNGADVERQGKARSLRLQEEAVDCDDPRVRLFWVGR